MDASNSTRNQGTSLLIPQEEGSHANPIRRTPLSSTERVRNFRARNRAKSADQVQTESRDQNREAYARMTRNWDKASEQFDRMFMEDSFGCVCYVCDRLWFRSDLKNMKPEHLSLVTTSETGGQPLKVCSSCYQSLNKGRIPQLSVINGFKYPPKPAHLPPLDPITARLISPRLPFMSIRRLRRDGQFGIIGQIINIPVDVSTMCNNLPRLLSDDLAFNVSIKRRLIHKSTYLSGIVTKRVIADWLASLIKSPLYRRYGINVDWTNFDREISNQDPEECQNQPELIENLDRDRSDNEFLIARQQTLMWNESREYVIAPGQNQRPLSIIFDDYAEELSFPGIYYGHPRIYKPGISVTPFMTANSEIRRSDRRGVTPEHILYMASKIIRLRVVDGIYRTFRCISQTENVTRSMLKDKQFLDDCVERNFAFLKTLPNSAQYWTSRKRDLFAMLRQIGKPTCFLTLSANEMNWPHLLSILHKFSDRLKDIPVTNPLTDLDPSQRSHLVNEDPVICCIYFDKLVEVIMRLIVSKRSYNPFGKYRVIDYFLRIEFQHRGSPHAHILLWMENDPKEVVSEDMQASIGFMNELFSVNHDHLGPSHVNQVHKHTFTCTKRGEESCRFNIPFWPCDETRILVPMAKDDNRISAYARMSKKLKKSLSNLNYKDLSEFLKAHNLDITKYLDIIRSSIKRPTVIFKRHLSEINTNTFNPWIASTLKSNMDIQFILDEFSCASYVVDYVNKANRGTGNLHRELIKLSEEFPEMTQDSLIKKVAAKIVNSVELSAQEGAWYLLRQPMSRCSRDVVYIPTCWPEERQKSHKLKKELENIDENSTEIWKQSIIERYEKRPKTLESMCLAEFAAWFSRRRDDTIRNDQICSDSDYYKRKISRIIRYRNYDASDSLNYKREMVLLYVRFRSEHVEILDRQKFLALYDLHIEEITRKRQEFESSVNFDNLMREYDLHKTNYDDARSAQEEREVFVRGLLPENETENFEDFDLGQTNTITSVRTRQNVMTKEEYCEIVQTTNRRQRELILEVIHRLHSFNEQPLQIFFTGPAGCGKTYVLKLIMETYNRYTQNHRCTRNSYLACASTGKAAVNLGGTTVHSAFHITKSRRRDKASGLSCETLQRFRQGFDGVRCIIIDEISMLPNYILNQVNNRLQDVTGEFDASYGGMDMIFCGDFRQLPPVFGDPVYKGCRNQLSGTILWQSLDYFNLNQVMRQSDIVFSEILTKIGAGEALTDSEAQLIESRFRTRKWCDENLKEAIRLFDRNALVNAYNQSVIQGGRDHVANDLITGYSNHQGLESHRAKLHRMSANDTSNLHYNVILAVGYPYLITTNIDIEDSLVNGTLGILRFIEEKFVEAENNNLERVISRLWFEFPGSIGTRARSKHRSNPSQNSYAPNVKWTPIVLRSASINLGGSVKCRRTQFPVVPACAMTIHKSQGGTFNQAIIHYDREQRNQLVYVALSRVTSIDGLYLVNEKDDFTFYHKTGCHLPSVNDVRDEYERLRQHPLNTLTNKVESFLAKDNPSMVICTINSQSLEAHAKDIETDGLITKSQLLVLTETWLNTDSVTINGYDIVKSCHSQRQNLSGLVSSAGGVAIYQRATMEPRFVPMHQVSFTLHNLPIGESASVGFSLDDRSTVIICGVYIHPRASKAHIEQFLQRVMHSISTSSEEISTPYFIVTGDFNCDIKKDKWIINHMRDVYGLVYSNNDHPTTLGNTCIDLTFSKNLAVTSMAYVSYFSYHRPLFNKISINV